MKDRSKQAVSHQEEPIDFNDRLVASARSKNLSHSSEEKREHRIDPLSQTHEIELPSGRVIDTQHKIVPELTSTLERMLNLLDETSTSLAEREGMFRALAETIPSPVYVHHNMKVLFANNSAARFHAYSNTDDLVQEDLTKFIHTDDLSKGFALFQKKKSGENISGTYLFRIKNASGRYILHSAHMQTAVYRGLDVVITVTRDLSIKQSLKKEIQNEKLFLTNVLDSISVPTILTDLHGNITEYNHAAESLLGMAKESVIGQHTSIIIQLVDERSRGPLSDPVSQVLQEAKVIKKQDAVLLEVHSSDKQFVNIEFKATPLYTYNNKLRGVSLEFNTITEQQNSNEILTYQATHDSLTGLINRREFETRLKNSLEEVKKDGRTHVLCYVDLNRFKPVNDRAGHQAGDAVLIEVAQKLKEIVRETDSVGRIGGDEFGILLHRCPLDKARSIAKDLCEKISNYRFAYQEHTFSVGLAIGMVVLEDSKAIVADLLNAADVACYTAKESQVSDYHVFDFTNNTIHQRDQGSVIWRKRIQEALSLNGFELFVQRIFPVNEVSFVRPISGLESTFHKTQRKPAYEVNVRMIDNYGTMYRPDLFIPAARSHGLMSSIDRIVVQNTFDAIAQGWINLKNDQSVCINLSADTFSDEKFLDILVESMDQYNIDPRKLCFEVPEVDIINHIDAAKRFIAILNDLGCQFAIDDFGRELESYSYLRELDISYIKVDGFYLKTVKEDEVNRAMVAAMIKLAHSLGMQVIAEQVESMAALNVLAELGADFAQGEAVSPVQHLHDALQ